MTEPVPNRIEVGSVIDGTYEITRMLGQGGMGTVWEARHLRLPGRRVAVKFLLTETSRDEQAHARFRHEAEIASQLGHSNIVNVLDFNELPDGTPYMLLELLHGESLRERLQRGPLPLDEALEITRQVGSALATANRAGVVHRDLKPENIFLCRTEIAGSSAARVKVLDFGISKIRGSDTVRTLSDSVLGTPRYMSPEQAAGKNDLVDQRTDVFALGAVVYEMLAGRPAFPGDRPFEILMRVVNEEPASIASACPDLPPHVAAAVVRAMAKDPAQRFASVDEFTAALSQLPADTSSLGTGGSSWRRRLLEPGSQRLSRRSVLAGLTATALAGGGLAVFWNGWWRQSGPLPAALPDVDQRPPSANTIAVMQFENQRADDLGSDWYCKALQTAFNTELSKLSQLSVVAPELIEQTAQQVGLDRMAAAGRLGVSRFVTGSFAVLGDVMRIDARVVDANSGLQEAAEKVEGSQQEFFGLQRDLTLAILTHFQVKLTQEQEASLTSQTNARVDKYRMLLEAEGVTRHEPRTGATPAPQTSKPDGPGEMQERTSWIRFPLLAAAHAQQPADDPHAAALEVLEAYREAHEAGDLPRLAALYVSFPESQRRAVNAYAQHVSDLQVELHDVQIQPRDHDIVVSYTRRDRVIDNQTGEPLSLEVRLTRFLVRDSGRWKFAATEE